MHVDFVDDTFGCSFKWQDLILNSDAYKGTIIFHLYLI